MGGCCARRNGFSASIEKLKKNNFISLSFHTPISENFIFFCYNYQCKFLRAIFGENWKKNGQKVTFSAFGPTSRSEPTCRVSLAYLFILCRIFLEGQHIQGSAQSENEHYENKHYEKTNTTMGLWTRSEVGRTKNGILASGLTDMPGLT